MNSTQAEKTQAGRLSSLKCQDTQVKQPQGSDKQRKGGVEKDDGNSVKEVAVVPCLCSSIAMDLL